MIATDTRQANVEPVVATTHGKVRGQRRCTVYGDAYYCFDGIPYAEPPVGALRFRAPLPAAAWSGVKDCTQVAPKCIQYNRYTKQVEGSEDCLFLNVYAKKLESERPLPVMVYVHGGGFATGDASRRAWGPDYFMMKDVVFITIGHRLGALGFISFPERDLEVPGNAGLKDIALALRWIKQNCHHFNGDPANITLFGHSSGSCATQLLMSSPQCKGLFHKVILMAGLHPILHVIPNMPYRLAKHTGYDGVNQSAPLFEYLSTVAAEQLVRYDFWTQEELDRGHHYAFTPYPEPYETPQAILLKQPAELLADDAAWSHTIPTMLGATSFEGLIQYKFYKNPALYESYQVHPEYFLPRQMLTKCDVALQKHLAPKFVELHFSDKEFSAENGECAMDKQSYQMTIHPMHRFLQIRLPHSRAPTYLYRFDFDSPVFNLYRIKHCGPDVRGVGHVDELSYVFYMPESFELDRSSAEFRTIERMVAMWTAFAASSDPNTSLIAPTVWQPLQREGARKCLNISHDISFIDYPEADKCAAWDRLYDEAGLQLI